MTPRASLAVSVDNEIGRGELPVAQLRVSWAHRWSRYTRVALWLVVFLAAVVLPLFRQQGVHSWRTIWAEDGALYSRDALRGHAFGDLFKSYAGYAQFIPRLAAVGVSTVPLRELSIYLAVAATLIGALVAAFAYRSLRGWIRDPALRVVVPALIVLAPVLVFENTASIVNSIWVVLFAGACAFVSREERVADVVLRAVAAFLAATSVVLAALILPLGLAVTLLRRRRADVVVLVVFVAGLAIQALVVVHSTDPTPTTVSRAADLPPVVSVRLFGSLLVGDHWVGQMWSAWGTPLIGVFALVAVGIAIALAIGAAPTAPSKRADRWMPGILAVTAVIVFVVPVWLRGTSGMRVVEGQATEGGARYIVVPLLLLVTAGCILADRLGPFVRRLVVAQTALVIVFNFYAWNPRSGGPLWPESVSAATSQCQGLQQTPVDLPISPPSWTVTVSCTSIPP